MAGIKVGENEPFENALRRFKKQCAKAGFLTEVRKRQHFEKPSIKRKKKGNSSTKKSHQAAAHSVTVNNIDVLLTMRSQDLNKKQRSDYSERSIIKNKRSTQRLFVFNI